MGHAYKAVQWTPFKKVYDLALALGVGFFLAVFMVITFLTTPAGESWSEIQVLIRAFGVVSFALLHLVLAIGPLARLSPRFKPLLYNRRHMGVTLFLLALVHAGLVLLWYHGFSETNVFVSLFASNPRYESLAGFPFESLGFIALVILFLMAATSHDFWNANLGPDIWKALHMSVYVAYGLLIAHVVLGVVQYERSLIYPVATALGAAGLATLHLLTGLRERAFDLHQARTPDDGWVQVCAVDEIPEARAVIIALKGGDRVAVFRHQGRIAAVANACRHQNGPLGEGRILDGCITCPWHGFQYRPEDGCAPPPFTEKIATFIAKIENGSVYIDPNPLKPGTPREMPLIPGAGKSAS